MSLDSLLWRGGVGSHGPLWLRMIQTIQWTVSCEGGQGSAHLPEGVHPWAYPEWHEQVRRCKDRHVADRLPRSIV